MSLRPTALAPVPAETTRIARAAFPKGTLFLRMRDERGTIFQDEMFAAVSPSCGQPACAPWGLALVTLMPLVETLSDRQAAEAVRTRIDWKDALGLDLTDPDFDFTVLSEFCWRCPAGRARRIAGGVEEQLLATLVERGKERGLVQARGQQRTDSTPVLAAIRVLSRLDLVGETLRAALNDLALAAPEWLTAQVEADWFERYGRRIEDDRLPKGEAARRAHGEMIGRDGHHLLAVLWAPTTPPVLRAVPAVETLRRVCIQHFHPTEGGVRWRDAADLPPASLGVESPYDTEAHDGTKRSAPWTGDKVHLTETCDADAPHLIVQVTTVPAPEADADRAAPIQTALVAADCDASGQAFGSDAGQADRLEAGHPFQSDVGQGGAFPAGRWGDLMTRCFRSSLVGGGRPRHPGEGPARVAAARRHAQADARGRGLWSTGASACGTAADAGIGCGGCWRSEPPVSSPRSAW